MGPVKGEGLVAITCHIPLLSDKGIPAADALSGHFLCPNRVDMRFFGH